MRCLSDKSYRYTSILLDSRIQGAKHAKWPLVAEDDYMFSLFDETGDLPRIKGQAGRVQGTLAQCNQRSNRIPGISQESMVTSVSLLSGIYQSLAVDI